VVAVHRAIAKGFGERGGRALMRLHKPAEPAGSREVPDTFDPGHPPSLAALIAAAHDAPGGTDDVPQIMVPPGVYREPIMLDRPVALIARDGLGSVEIAVDSGVAVTVRADSVLRGVIVRSGDPVLAAISVEAGAPRFEQCEVHGARVETAGDSTALLHACTIRNATLAGLYATGRSRPSLEECVIADTLGHGVAAAQHAAPRVYRTTVSDAAGAGFRIVGDARADIADCSVLGGGGPGLVVEQEAGARMRACRISGAATVGVHIVGSSPLRDRRLPFDTPTPLDDMMSGVYGPAQAVLGVTLLDCEVLAAGAEGLIADGGEIRLERSRIAGSGGSGVLARGSARIEFEVCGVADSTAMGVVVRGGARLTATRLSVAGCGGYGFVAAEGAVVVLGESACTAATLSAVMLSGHAQLSARRTSFGQAAGHGLWVRGHAVLQLDGCEVGDCGQDGIRVEGYGEATVRDSRVARCRSGVVLTTQHHPVLDRCTVADIAGTGITVGPGGIPLIRGCTVSRADPSLRGTGATTGMLAASPAGAPRRYSSRAVANTCIDG